jgi:hypothetical protein
MTTMRFTFAGNTGNAAPPAASFAAEAGAFA